jgi:hypothetical protein
LSFTTVLSDKYMAMVGEPGGKDWGVNEATTGKVVNDGETPHPDHEHRVNLPARRMAV